MIPVNILNLSPYVPGRLIEDVEAELGLSGIIKLASNENSLGPSPLALNAMAEVFPRLHRYSDADARGLKKALVKKFGFDPATIVAGNGSSEFILLLSHALLGPGLNAVMSRPSFTLYETNVRAAGAEARQAPLTAQYGHDLPGLLKLVDEKTRLVFIDNPLNPTGAWLEPEDLAAFHQALPDKAVLVVDEAYVEFSRRGRMNWKEGLLKPGRLAVLRTFSKIYGLAGLRVAYALMDPVLAEAVNKIRQPFNMNALAQVGAAAALEDDDFIQRSLKMTWDSLDYFQREMSDLGLIPRPTEANFLMVDLLGRLADEVFQAVLRKGLITRSLTSFGLSGHLRVTAGLAEESRALIDALKGII